MKQIIHRFIFILLIIGVKIMLCSYTCPTGCSIPSIRTTCQPLIAFENIAGTNGAPSNLIPTTSTYYIDIPTCVNNGWRFSINIQSDVYCQNIEVHAGQNTNLIGNILEPGIYCNIPVSTPMSVSIGIEGPCNYPNTHDRWYFYRAFNVQNNYFSCITSLTNNAWYIQITNSANPGC